MHVMIGVVAPKKRVWRSEPVAVAPRGRYEVFVRMRGPAFFAILGLDTAKHASKLLLLTVPPNQSGIAGTWSGEVRIPENTASIAMEITPAASDDRGVIVADEIVFQPA